MIFMIKTKDSNTLQAFWVALGSLVSFGFSIVSSMILSRYLTKDDYGTYKQVLYVYNTLLIVFTLGLPKAYSYFLPKIRMEEGKNLVNKITKVFFILGGIFSLLLYFSAPTISEWLNNEKLAIALRIFSPAPFLMLPTMGLESIYSTYRKTYISSIYVVVSRIIMLFCVIFPVIIMGSSYIHALKGFVIASLLSFIIALFLKNAPFKGLTHKKSDITYPEILKYSFPLLIASLWGVVISSSDQFFISRYYGSEVFADFSNGAIELPFVGMIIGACGTVLLPLFSKINNEEADAKSKIFEVWMSVFRKTILLIYPAVLFCIFYAPEIMELLYGENYKNSGYYFRIKLFANFFTLISYAPIILAIGKTKYYANVHMFGAIVLIFLESIVTYLINSPYILLGVSVTCHIGRIFTMLIFVAKYFKITVIELLPIQLMIKICIPSIVILFGCRSFLSINSKVYTLIVSVAIYGIAYLISCKILNVKYLFIINPLKNAIYKGRH